ncbi:cytochrome P450 [Granulicella sp. dw_53]|uniref:cytochrome P450 n=1 Tax=Granulicella sp. dw_53 TaxID=2719792 RepID=UPI001BD48B35|nr:cytochrome P450 [Granulicella sp. dw_53]
MATIDTVELSDAARYNIFAPANIQEPFGLFTRLREEKPVHWHEKPLSFWSISRYEDVRTALRDSQRFSSNNGSQMARRAEKLPASVHGSFETAWRILMNNVQRLDAPAHTIQRQSVVKAFMALVTGAFKKTLEKRVSRQLDKLESSATCDFVEDFAYPLPSQAIFDLLGVPEEHRELIRDTSNLSAKLVVAIYNNDVPLLERITEQAVRTEAVLLALFEKRRREPEEDLISVLVSTDSEMPDLEISSLCIFLLAAGDGTTANLISGSLRYMLTDRRQWNHLLNAPELIPSAIEELLRFVSPVVWLQRVATEDIEVQGHIIRRGDEVRLGLGAANRDPEKFADPDVLDVTRKNVTSLSFGYGMHTCLGAAMARMQTEAALSQLLQRMPQIELATDHFEYQPVYYLRSLKSLPVKVRD